MGEKTSGRALAMETVFIPNAEERFFLNKVVSKDVGMIVQTHTHFVSSFWRVSRESVSVNGINVFYKLVVRFVSFGCK